MIEEALLKKVDDLPSRPGVYLMRDRQGQVIYVGKAIDLRVRVRSYFQRHGPDDRAFIRLLDRVLGDVEAIVVGNEKESLLLENELIKKYRPRFNVQLRDDKNFLCLRLDQSHPYPRLETVRRVAADGARYFGPYASAASIREMLRVINRHFQLRTCSDRVLETRQRPCLLHQLGRCPAPCVYPISAESYGKNVESAALFLEGRSQELSNRLTLAMKEAARILNFEEAARIRDRLHAIERSLERQIVATTENVDEDVLGIFREGDRIALYVLFVRGGRLAGGRAFQFTSEFPADELLHSFANQYYDRDQFIPGAVLLPDIGCEVSALAEILSERRGRTVEVAAPQRGDRHSLVALATDNARRAHSDFRRSREETTAILTRLRQRLRLKQLPRRIECFDVSHFGGSATVASQVASENLDLVPARYRRYRLRTVDGNDDFRSIYEVVARRLKSGLTEGDLPDLMVIDGGKGQLGAAHAALKDLGVSGLDVVALAKSRNLESGDKDPVSSPERVFVLGTKDPIVLSQTSAELFALTRLRDEAHRFAITYQRKLIRRRGIASTLEEIPGVGSSRRSALLSHFGSLRSLREATEEEIGRVDGIGTAVAARVHTYLHQPTVSSVVDLNDEEHEAALAEATL